MTTAMLTTDQEAREIRPDEAVSLFDAAARRYLKMSGKEFLVEYESGAFSRRPDLAHRVSCVAMLLPLLHR